MPKTILIFSDGTGQIGGVHPDQRLSNIYKMYRAMRPGPSSPIKPSNQVAFYDAGLGAGETDGLTFRKVRNLLESAVGTGIDENVIDCYENIISTYEPGDKVLVFGFSRGAYTARAVTNVMNLCGVPTKMPDGSAVPKYGPRLRKIATDAVQFVYNHGAGSKRGKYEDEREEKARRFRAKYGSNAAGEKAHEQGNVQPTFVGVFDTVAALGDVLITWIVRIVLLTILGLTAAAWYFSWPVYLLALFTALSLFFAYRRISIFKTQFKYFSPNPEKPLRFLNPFDWPAIFKLGHYAVWNSEHYDKFLDPDVGFARHAIAIDEHRLDFPRVKWAGQSAMDENAGKKPEWFRQVWFPGCHSDIGGSYPEPESRLSDISLNWMIEELQECVPEVQINEDMLIRSPDPLALQHEETYMFKFGWLYKKWKTGPRKIPSGSNLHSSIFDRLKSKAVPQLGDVKPYRPIQLATHNKTKKYYDDNS